VPNFAKALDMRTKDGTVQVPGLQPAQVAACSGHAALASQFGKTAVLAQAEVQKLLLRRKQAKMTWAAPSRRAAPLPRAAARLLTRARRSAGASNTSVSRSPTRARAARKGKAPDGGTPAANA